MTTRRLVAAASTLVVKVGSSSLTSLDGGLDAARLDALVDAVAARRASGSQVVLVSSGAIAAGLAPLGLVRRPADLATQQAAASVGQLQLAHAYSASFARHGVTVGQVLLTQDDVIRRSLLAAGVHGVEGDFVAGDVVDLVGPHGVVARGVVAFDAAELPALIGRRTRDLPPEYRRELVHADDLVPVSAQ